MSTRSTIALQPDTDVCDYFSRSPALISSPPYEAVGGYYREEAIMLLRRFYLTENSNGEFAELIQAERR